MGNKHIEAKGFWISLVWIAGIGTLIRIPVLLGVDALLWPDSLLYYHTAQTFLETGSLVVHPLYHTPLFPLFLSLFLPLQSGVAAAGQWFLFSQQILGISISCFSFLLLLPVFGKRLAFWSALLLTLHPLLLYYEASVLTEVLFMFFFTLALVMTMAALREPGAVRYALLGILLALATLVRPVAQPFVLVPTLALMWAGRQQGWKVVVQPVLVLVFYLLSLWPWMEYNYRAHGFFGVSKGAGLNLFYRAIQVTGLAPAPGDRLQDKRIKTFQQLERQLGDKAYFSFYDRLAHKLASKAEADEVMAHIAWHAIQQSPVRFFMFAAFDALRLLVAPRKSIQFCTSATGAPWLCIEHTRGLTRPGFLNGRSPHLLARRLVHYYLDVGCLLFSIAGWAMVLALLLLLVRRALTLELCVFLVSVGYFCVVTALFNIPEDRYRLPVDMLVLGFAVFAISQLWEFFGARFQQARNTEKRFV